jgi:UDP-N-acetylmuramoylalanine--D-glutamate ligase
MGESKEELARRLRAKGYGQFSTATNMEEAVSAAYAHASTGDTVVLCPGYSSQDMYTNFEKRGEAFVSVLSDLYGLNYEK